MMRALILIAVLIAPLAHAQIGHVVSVQGTAMVERSAQPGRILGAGEKLEQKDVINTAQASHAVLEFRDKTRITLRPNTVFRVESYADAQDAKPQGMVLGLVRGGFRAVTGEIGKANPQAVRFQTETTILGIRGTEFDARLCEGDCAQEERTIPLQRVRAVAAARVLESQGTLTATDANGLERTLVPGALLTEGETVATAEGARAVIVFSDGSRITLGERAKLAIARFRFDRSKPNEGLGHVRLLGGNAYVSTGALAKIGPDAFLFETSSGVIRPRGTGFGVSDGEVVVMYAWDGSIIIQTATERFELASTNTGAVAIKDGRITFLPEPPPHLVAGANPRPDLVSVDPTTFGRSAGGVEQGLYVWVRDGTVTLGSGPELIEIKAGTAIRAGSGGVALLPAVPNFMRFDLTPRPGLPGMSNVLPFFRASDGSITNMCGAR